MSLGGSGGSLKDQLMSVWRQTGERPKQLDDLKELPECCLDIWRIFIDLHNSRQSSGFGVSPISFTEIYSYSKLYKYIFEEWEIRLLNRFDNEVLKLLSEKMEKEKPAKK